MKGTDFVFVWINKGAHALTDLRYALRSLEQHWIGNIRVTIVGDDPGFTGKVWHAPHERAHSDRMDKALDAVRKMQAIIGLRHVQERFVYMYDDTYLLRAMDESYLSVRRAVREIPQDWPLELGTRQHRHAMSNTVQALRDAGHTRIWDYETHMPRMFEKRKLLEVIHLYKAEERRLLLPTLYFNHHYRNQEPQLLHKFDDVKVVFTGRSDGVSVPPALTSNELMQMDHYRPFLINKHFWNHNDRGIDQPGLQYLRHSLWPEESSFERAPNPQLIKL